MDTAVDIVTRLAEPPHEEEWLEFKANWCEPRIWGGVCIRPLQRRSLSPKPTQKLESPAAELFQIGLLETSGASEERSLGLREPALGAPSLN